MTTSLHRLMIPALLLCTSLLHAEETGHIELADGDLLHGTLASMTSEQLAWSRPDIDRPLTFPMERVRRLAFPSPDEAAAGSPPARVVLRSGQSLMLRDLAFSEDTLHGQSLFGPVAIDRKQLHSVFFHYDPAKVYQGPRSADEWRYNSLGQSSSNNVDFVNGALVAGDRFARANRTINEMPPVFLWSFTVEMTPPEAQTPPQGRRVHRSSMPLNINLVFACSNSHQRAYFYLRNGKVQVRSQGGQYSEVEIPASMKANNKGQFQIAVDRETGILQIAIDRTHLADLRLGTDLPDTVTFQYYMYNGNQTRVRNICIEPWDRLPLQQEMGGEADLLVLPNGDIQRSPLRRITDDTIATDALTLPLNLIYSLRFAGSGEGADALDTANAKDPAQLLLRDGGQLTCNSLSATAEHFKAVCSGLGELTLPLTAVKNVEWNRATEPPNGYIRQWSILGPMRELEPPDAAGNPPEGFFDRLPKVANPTGQSGESVKVNNRALRWQTIRSRSGGVTLSVPQRHLLWGVAYVRSREEVTNATLSFGSDDDSIWFLNDKEVLRVREGRSLTPDQNVSAPLTLNQGENVLRFIVYNRTGPSGIAARFLQKNGLPVEGLEFSPTPKTPPTAPPAQPAPDAR